MIQADLGIGPLLPRVAAVVLLLGGGYLFYARARIEEAIAAASRRAGVRVQYRASSSWRPGHVRLRDVVITSGSPEWSLRLERIDLGLVPVLGGPRSVWFELPDQLLRLRAANLQWESRLRASGELVGLEALGPSSVRRADIDLRHGVLQSPAHVLRAVRAALTLTAAQQSEAGPFLRGTLSVRGGSGAELLALIGSKEVTRSLVPNGLREPFELDAQISLTPALVTLEPLAARCGDVSLEGALQLRSSGPSGAVLVKTTAREVGLRFDDREIRRELAPGPAWLERQVAATGSAQTGLARPMPL
jgi:hypothetical protein